VEDAEAYIRSKDPVESFVDVNWENEGGSIDLDTPVEIKGGAIDFGEPFEVDDTE